MKIFVDGAEHVAKPEVSVLDALDAVGVHVPTLCHDPRLKPIGSCGMCAVELRGPKATEWNVAPACATSASEGMQIRTQSERLEEARRWTLELLFSRHSRAARSYPERKNRPSLVCACRGHATCVLRRLCLEGDAQPDRLGRPDRDPAPVLLRHGIELEMAKCVRCDRCVRMCREVVGVEALSFHGRGSATELIYETPASPELKQACDDCEEGGALCIETCPTDALHAPRKLKVVK